MKKFALVVGSCLVALGAYGVGHLTAQDHKNLKNAPAMTPEMEKMMAAMMEKAAPGAEHERLTKLAGKWKFEVKHWETPGTEPHVSVGTSSVAPIMGGRYILQSLNSDWNGMPFEGMATMGYDKFLKKYVSTWIDNMGTGIAVSRGDFDAAKKQFVMMGEMYNPMIDAMQKCREVTTIVSDSKHVMEMFCPGPDGKEFRSMEITYTRQ